MLKLIFSRIISSKLLNNKAFDAFQNHDLIYCVSCISCHLQTTDPAPQPGTHRIIYSPRTQHNHLQTLPIFLKHCKVLECPSSTLLLGNPNHSHLNLPFHCNFFLWASTAFWKKVCLPFPHTERTIFGGLSMQQLLHQSYLNEKLSKSDHVQWVL